VFEAGWDYAQIRRQPYQWLLDVRTARITAKAEAMDKATAGRDPNKRKVGLATFGKRVKERAEQLGVSWGSDTTGADDDE
jgi:hypothetical protein